MSRHVVVALFPVLVILSAIALFGLSSAQRRDAVIAVIVPGYETLEEDDFAQFTCSVEPPGTRVIRRRWSRQDGQRLPIGRHFYFDAHRSDLIIDPLSISDSGVYICTVQTSRGVVSATAELVVEPYRSTTACTSSPCQNGGLCLLTTAGYQCECTNRYYGLNCERVRGTTGASDACLSQPCENGAECSNMGFNEFTCTCAVGFSGALCTQEIGACTSNPCQNVAECINHVNGYTCQCAIGYLGIHCEQLDDNCYSQPCLHGGVCYNALGRFDCQCRGGWGGNTCEEDTDDCLPNPCYNRGVCQDMLGAYSCSCRNGYRGPRCQEDIDECQSSPCQNNGRCTDGDGKFECQCRPGYEGLQCEHNIDECQSSPCVRGGQCVDRVAGFYCRCRVGLFGRRCEQGSLDRDPCLSEPCLNGGTCTLTLRSYECSCVAGTSGDNCEQRDGEPPVLPSTATMTTAPAAVTTEPETVAVTTMTDACQPDPCVNGDCDNDAEQPSGYLCRCNQGFFGSLCDEIVLVLPFSSQPGHNYRITTYQYSDVGRRWLEVGAGASASVDSFPVRLSPLSAGYFAVRIDDVDNGVVTETIALSVHGEADTFVPAWAGEGIVNPVDGGEGRVDVQLRLPPYQQQQSDDAWMVEYRTDSQAWQALVFSASQLLVKISDLTYGLTTLRVRVRSGQGYSAYSPEIFLTIQDHCAGSPCENSGVCTRTMSSFQCQCQPGYTGATCREDIDDCISEPCDNGGTCIDHRNAYTCECVDDYGGSQCDQRIDECLSDPCRHGAQCVDALNSFTCACQPGYQGDLCQEDVNECASHPCQHGGRCQDQVNGYRCACSEGYTGSQCQQVTNECSSNPCAHGSTCVDAHRNYSCVCSEGYTGRNCDTEVCEVESPCVHGDCHYMTGLGMKCTCRQGYEGSICSQEMDHCASQPCVNGATCSSSLAGYACTCTEGHTGPECRQALDACASQPCSNNGVCRNSPSSYTCECPEGFSGSKCETMTAQACDSSPCRHSGTCRNEGSGYRCRCRPGYEGSDCSTVVVPKGPCSPSPCKNGGQCYGRGNRYRCYCRSGYRGTNCEQENCKVRGEVFSYCARSCPATCDQPVPSCPRVCVAACKCDVGLVYGNSSRLTCVQSSRCPYPAIEPASSIKKPGSGSFLQCSASVPLSEISAIRWARADGSPLAPGRHHYFTRNSVLYISDHERGDTGNYTCEVFTGLMSQRATSRIEVTDVKATITPHNTRGVQRGSVSFRCDVSPASAAVKRITWTRADGRSFSSGRTKISDDRRVLSIDSIRRSDSAEYRCTVVTNLGVTQGKTTFVVGEKGCIADGRLLGDGESRYVLSKETLRGTRPAADVIFLVDESRSMEAEHAWLANVSLALDNSLITNGIGEGVPNLFGLIGFAKDDPNDILGRAIPMPDGEWMGTAEQFNQVRNKLALNGRHEDMYSAIQLALDFYPLRPGMACQIVGVTDEGRTPLAQADGSPPLLWQHIHDRLKARGCFLNVIVNQQMKSFEELGIVDALGVTGNNDSTVEVPGGNFRISRGTGGAVARSGHGTTHHSYTQLAFSTGGAAWDLNRLRLGGDTARAFTKAFVWLKEREISQQLCTSCRCVGSTEPVCMPGCIIEKPQVILTSTSTGQGNTLSAINEGGLAEFICEADGEPLPKFTWTVEGGGDLPADAKVYGAAGRSVLQVPNVQSRICVECVASNDDGFLKKVQCLDSLGKCTLPGRAVEVLHGDSVRNYSTHRGDDVVRLPSSAIVVLAVDESGSMVGEHLWLNTTVLALEENLMAKGVGVLRPNRYALVGFASPAHVTGRIIPLSAGGEHCGTAEEMSGALSQLKVDGTLEDGYAAMNLALNNISCLQAARPKEVACQIILTTDEGRDELQPALQYDQMLDALSRKDCILNVVVWERFRGRELPSAANRRPRWQGALGIDRHNKAVMASGEEFSFLPDGAAWAITGRENTHDTYVHLATQTGGGAWDLQKLRTEQYRQAFTNGFIAAKVEEIQQQIFGQCQECRCDRGQLACDIVAGVSTRQRCVRPPASRQLGVVIAPLKEHSVDGVSYAKFQCSALLQGSEEDNNMSPITVTWVTHPIQAVVDVTSNELQFSNLTAADEGTYTCQARNADGYSEATVDLHIAPQDSRPQRGGDSK